MALTYVHVRESDSSVHGGGEEGDREGWEGGREGWG